MKNQYTVYITLFLFIVLTLILHLIPALDLCVSRFFYDHNFIYKENVFAVFLFRCIPIVTKFFTIFCILYVIHLFARYKNINTLISSYVCFFIIAIVLGPGLLINGILKEHYGRARPREIIEFGGVKSFTPAFQISNQCHTNCSFASGHAAMGFYFTVIAYTVRRFTITYLLAIIFGLLVGLSRIMMGGHFISDVTASAAIVLCLNHVIYILWQKRRLKSL